MADSLITMETNPGFMGVMRQRRVNIPDGLYKHNDTIDNFVISVSANGSEHSLDNISLSDPVDEFDNPFNDPKVKFMFIGLYFIVFLICCIGNSLVLYTIGRTKRMRTRTNFFLANLAVADLGVGIVCVLPKLSTFLWPTWVLGQVMCKVFYFAQSMTYTASMLLLTAIAVERYIAIIHPLRSRCLFTQNRLVLAQVSIWVAAAAYNSPELSMFDTITLHSPNGTSSQTFCFLTKPYPSMRDFYTVTFFLWYILPLCIMTLMYSRVARALWKASVPSEMNGNINLKRISSSYRNESRQEAIIYYEGSVSKTQIKRAGNKCNDHLNNCHDSMRPKKMSDNNNATSGLLCLGNSKNNSKMNDCVALHINHADKDSASGSGGGSDGSGGSGGAGSGDVQIPSPVTRGRQHPVSGSHDGWHRSKRYLMCDFTSEISEAASSDEYDMLNSKGCGSRRVRCQYRVNSQRVLNSRRRVIRLLMVVLMAFALCVLPYHLKFILLYWHVYPTIDTKFDILSPLAYIMLYMNSALNPILYWLFSDSFRRSFKETCCRQASRKPCWRHDP